MNQAKMMSICICFLLSALLVRASVEQKTRETREDDTNMMTFIKTCCYSIPSGPGSTEEIELQDVERPDLGKVWAMRVYLKKWEKKLVPNR